MKSLFAIRQKSTGFFLPALSRRTSRGGTSTEPMDPHKRPLRLFTTMTGAKNALRWWLEGIYVIVKNVTDNPIQGRDESWDIEREDAKYQPFRSADDMEIVEIRVQVFRSGVNPEWESI